MNHFLGDRQLRLEDIPKSRFCMWLFVSTEVMFFVALIGSYVIIRFGVPRSDWPTASMVGLEPWIGGANTVLLLASSFFVTRAVALTARDQAGSAKRSLLFALVLGTGFLAVKSYEYREKFLLGIYPRPQGTLVYPRFDTEYLAAVQGQIATARVELERELKRRPDPSLEQRIALCDRLKLGMVSWAGREYAKNTDPAHRDLEIRAVAHAVRSLPEHATQIESFLRAQQIRLAGERDQLNETVRRLQNELTQTSAQLGELGSSPEIAARRTELDKLLSGQRNELTLVNNEWSVVDDRLKFLEIVPEMPAGINATYGLKLPIVVPGGRTWLNGYYLLSGIHALHLLAGVLVGLVLLAVRLDSRRQILVGNFAMYWNFVDAVWLVLFPIIYLL